MNVNKFLVDLIGLRHHLSRGFDLFIVLTSQPELDVFITELCFEEGSEGCQTIYEIKMNKIMDKHLAILKPIYLCHV